MKRALWLVVTLPILLLIVIAFVMSSSSVTASSVRPIITIEEKTGSSGTKYTVYSKGNYSVDFAVSRPDANDSKIVFCIPAAFTTTDYRVDGVYICKGKMGNANEVNNRIGGAFQISAGQGKIFPTKGGKLLTPAFLQQVVAQKGSLFQQFQVVLDGKGEKFTDNCRAQRRGIAVFGDGKMAVLESHDSITLTTLGTDAAAMGVQNLIYCDMGPWSEGWYRATDGKSIIIGQDRSMTFRQTNWVVFRSTQ